MEIIKEDLQLNMVCHSVEMQAAPRKFHWHDNFEICQVLKNHCTFLIDGARVEADEGDLIVVSSFTVHRFIIHEDHTIVRIVQFPAKLLMNVTHPVEPLRIHIANSEIAKIEGLQESLDRIFMLMEAEGRLFIKDDNPFLESLAAPLYFLLMRYFADKRSESTGTKERMDFYRITEYISANLSGDLTAQSMAKALFISRGRLTALFARYAGVSLNEYVNSLRIQHANALLDSGSSVTDAAFESGFQCIRTFNSVYKRLTGKTPTSRDRKNTDP